MAKTTQQKIKLLVLWDILCHNTDENNALSTDDIIRMLNDKGIEIVRKVLPSDIALLNEYGYEVLSYKKKSFYYYVVNRPLDTAEAVLLSDVIKASKLTLSQKKSIVHKLSEVSGEEHTLNNIIYCDTVKRSNSHILYSVDTINNAIDEGLQISFLYFSLDDKKQKIYHKEGARYIVNPLVMVWSKDNYYLVCYDDKHKGTANYRIDRMEKVETEETYITPNKISDNFNAEDYRKQIFSMFGGELVNVEISFPADMLDDIYDKFGENIDIRKQNDNNYRTITPIQVSPTFFTWIVGSCGKLKILSPRSVQDSFNEFVKQIKENY